jgi:ABC-type nitrate/sulfonate/bicarbonate transport system substrate-binding protein
MKSIKRRTTFNLGVLTLFISIIMVLMSCNGCNKKSSNKIRVGYLPMVSSLTHFVALEKGFYKEEGLDVEANPIKTSNLIAQDVITGNIDVAIELSIVPLLKQLEVNPDAAKIFSVSSINVENGFDGILVKPTSSIKGLKDLSGKKVGVFPGSTAKNSLMLLFNDSCKNMAPPVFIELDPSVHLQSLLSDEIDALFTYEPSLTIGMQKNGFIKAIPSIYGMQYSPSPIGVAAVNNKWATENPETAIKFYKAINKAVDFIKSNKAEATQILAKSTKLDPAYAARMNIMPMSKSQEIDEKNLDGFISLLFKMGEVSKQPKASEVCIKK